MNTFLLLATATQATTQQSTVSMDALATQAMLDTPPLELLGIGLLASIAFLAFFLLVFVIVSAIINVIVKLTDKYYEKTGKKRPVKKKKKSYKNF
jgi:hypothetical protein